MNSCKAAKEAPSCEHSVARDSQVDVAVMTAALQLPLEQSSPMVEADNLSLKNLGTSNVNVSDDVNAIRNELPAQAQEQARVSEFQPQHADIVEQLDNASSQLENICDDLKSQIASLAIVNAQKATAVKRQVPTQKATDLQADLPTSQEDTVSATSSVALDSKQDHQLVNDNVGSADVGVQALAKVEQDIKASMKNLIRLVDRTLRVMRNDDLHGANAMTERAFKSIVTCAAFCNGFDKVTSEHRVEARQQGYDNNYADLVLRKQCSDGVCAYVVVECKYVRGGFIRVVEGLQVHQKPHKLWSTERFAEYNKLGRGLEEMPARRLRTVQYRSAATECLATVDDELQETFREQLSHYVDAVAHGDIGRLHGHVYGIVVMGVANRVVKSHLIQAAPQQRRRAR
ncbi:unnamed protein product (mitochondrion) [Plasmodiophora brassicae]|uniref:Uncharacterized protein n=1 Tax=Plasmodiophora brassicae TaxID=37360 RepID=A0A0G4J4E2_PLABS|nr:hypothetical protein PBRA_002371 [Plasmodiophora brassicae]SPQ93701.1 unnamed protein product [Plasmodiophora brassicae]